MNRDVLARRLLKDGHRVLQAESGPQALSLLEQEPRVDIVLLDYMMPDMNGLDVLKTLKTNPLWVHIPVIMISAANEIERVVECIEAGAEDYLTKPFNPVLLQARLHASLEKKSLRDKEKAYLQQIQANQQQLVMQQKLSSIGALTAGIAYEIKTPLNYVSNFADLNREITENLIHEVSQRQSDIPLDLYDTLTELTQTLRVNTQKVLEHGKRADQIIRFMLTLARPSSNAWQKDNVHALLDQAVFFAFHVSQAKWHHFTPHLEKNYDPSLGDMMMASQDLCQAFLNIIDNAFYSLYTKHQRVGGHHTSTLRITTTSMADHIQIRFYDNGEGIPPELVDTIFQPFFSTKKTENANGLGLSMAREAIEQKHQGRLWATSVLGEWAEFFVEIPKNIQNSSD